jgi:hypothetical protein
MADVPDTKAGPQRPKWIMYAFAGGLGGSIALALGLNAFFGMWAAYRKSTGEKTSGGIAEPMQGAWLEGETGHRTLDPP